MRVYPIALGILVLTCQHSAASSLKEVFDQAGPAHGYDKYLELETGVTYTGGLWIGGTFNRIVPQFEGRGLNVRIRGNGAILDLQGGEICIAYCNNRLDIDDCIIVNGDIKYRGYHSSALQLAPLGSVRYVTFYRPHDYGVRTYGCGPGILVERNIVVDAVDTGPDFAYLSGYPHPNLPTGGSFAISLQWGTDAYYDNWSYHSDPVANADPLRHFQFLCDYG